jgi:lipid A 3-O-deacylase
VGCPALPRGRRMVTGLKMTVPFFLLFLLFPPLAETRQANSEIPNSTPSPAFVKNRLSAQFLAGALFGPVSWIQDHQAFKYAQSNLRLGWMASEAIKTKYFGTGNFEILFELTNSVVFKGSGRYLRGFSLLGRYNLLLPDPKWALYFQIGAGVIVNDAYRDLSQSAIGQAIEFTPQGSIGLHYFIGSSWTVDVEVMYHHVSNAGFSDGRNAGTNAVGGFLGTTYFFEKLWH